MSPAPPAGLPGVEQRGGPDAWAGVRLAGPVTRADIPRACASLRLILEAVPVGSIVCDVAGLTRPDAVVVDLLARLDVTARRRGSRLVLRGASVELLELVALLGLAGTLAAPASPVQVLGEPEDGEQSRVEEVRDAADPAV